MSICASVHCTFVLSAKPPATIEVFSMCGRMYLLLAPRKAIGNLLDLFCSLRVAHKECHDFDR